jgi:hypothetical protein
LMPLPCDSKKQRALANPLPSYGLETILPFIWKLVYFKMLGARL